MRKKQKAKRKQKSSKVKHSSDQGTRWVDNLEWLPVRDQSIDSEENPQVSHTTFGVVSWNVLADSYCSPRSHRGLPLKFQRHVFDRHQRQHHVRQVIRRLVSTMDRPLLALQEVDDPLQVHAALKELGYEGIETPTSPGGKMGRIDACCLFYDSTLWKCVESEIIRLDDLATLRTNAVGREKLSTFARSNLQGLQSSFLRKNMALLVRLENRQSNLHFVFAIPHLYWNPNYDYVKLCQTHHILERVKTFCKGEEVPVIICGDFNSQPGTNVYRHLTSQSINAKVTAPWYKITEAAEEEANPPHDTSLLTNNLQRLELSDKVTKATTGEVRYMLDFTLNRFCRWLRILGVDATLETEEEEKLRTKEGCFAIFDRCRKEHRTLVTTSSKLLLRKDCPPGAYLLDTKSLAKLELSLVHLLLSHGVILKPRNFLTRCVVCNGTIVSVTSKDRIREIFESHNAPDQLQDEILEVFQCSGCKQGYWWCEIPTSSASRVKNQATHLFEVCIRGGVPVDKDLGMFDFVDIAKVKACKGSKDEDEDKELRLLLGERLDVLNWMQDETLENPLGPLTSAYADDEGLEELQFTNVTHDFVGHLDHIFYSKNGKLKVTDQLYVPTTFEELNDDEISNGHLLPSNAWPSDHLAIGAKFSFLNPGEEKAQSTKDGPAAALFCSPLGGAGQPPPPPPSVIPNMIHEPKCGCGCVPNIPSLFEMAELRKQARLKAQNGG